MDRLGFVDQTELAHWANSTGARGDLPRLIRRLILETGRGVVRLGFPGGEGIATGGWDGTVRTNEATAFLPAGLSLWELSVDKSAQKKADKDYAKRLMTPDGSPTSDCTYVSVSLRRWAKRLEWAAKLSGQRWKDVRAYGVDDIETWLESAPVTHAWVSELLGLHPHGLLSAENWWDAWSGATVIPFPATAVLAGRQGNVEEIQAKLTGAGRITTVQGTSSDDVLAFISALALTDAEKGGSLLSRLAFVDKIETWRRLRGHSASLVLVPRTPEVIEDLGAPLAHHLIVPITGSGSADIELTPIDSQEASKKLVAAGLNERLAGEVGKLARMSLLAARRRIAQKPELHKPSWAVAPVQRLNRRSVLLGKWDEESAGDMSIASRILGVEYAAVRENIESLVQAHDPMFARLASSVGLVSHFDAWLLLKDKLVREDLEAFQTAAEIVFGEIHPALDLAPDDRWRAAYLGKVRSYSEDLRKGMAKTLALLGAHGSMVVSGTGMTGQDWASITVRRILEVANQDKTCRLWASLRDVLCLFAEAAPKVFLDAVRDGLQGEDPLLRRMFMDDQGSSALFTDSPHSNLLWALETCAWSPEDFGQVVDLLARLVEVDPGGRLGNRPVGCLAAIFRPWFPQSTISLDRRLAALDSLRKRHSLVAWKLMLSMLPESGGGIADYISEPIFRDWKPQTIAVTMAEYRRQIDETCRRLLDDIGNDSVRCLELLKGLNNMPPEWRAKALVSLSVVSIKSDDQRRQIWEEIRAQVSRHRRFAHAKWALPLREIEQLEAIAEQLRPSDPCKKWAWLFEKYMPNLEDIEHNDSRYDSELLNARIRAVAEIVNSSVWSEIQNFAITLKLPGTFGSALAHAGITTNEGDILDLLRTTDAASQQLASGYLFARFKTEGWPWVEDYLDQGTLTPDQLSFILLATEDFPKAWEVAEKTGEEISKAFWCKFRTYGHGTEFSYAVAAAQRMLDVGRPGGALDLLILYRKQDSDYERADLMAQCLEALLECNPESSDIRNLSQDDLLEVFSCLEQSLIDVDRLAKLEWAYLSIFDHSSPLVLSRKIAQDPSLFVEVVSCIYRPHPSKGSDNEEYAPDPSGVDVDSGRATIAKRAYQLLSGWRMLPGARGDGTVDGEYLTKWVSESRRLLREALRIEVGDVHIGSILASSPPAPDGIWPCMEVRDLLESLQSAKVEDGLRLRIHNDRGVTMRGMLDGGEQELELAAKYRKQAEQLSDQWPRTSSVLRGLAEGYEHQARRQDGEAERRRKGFEG